MPKVQVIVPCYNYARYLPACVESLLDPSMPDVGVLILDDASTDDSAAVAARLAAADPRVRVVVHETNRGHIATYNEGIARTQSDYLMVLSADDVLAPGALARASAILDRHPDIVLVHGGCIEWDDATPLPAPDTAPGDSWTRQDGADFAWEFCYCGFNVVHTPTVVVRTPVQKAVGGYLAELPHSGDMEMFLRFAPRGAIARVHATQAFKRCHDGNMSTGYQQVKWRDCSQRKRAFDHFFDEHAGTLPGAARMRESAEREMADSAFWIGVAQILEGRLDSGRALLGFATSLRPRLRYAPPFARLLREPRLHAHVGRLLASWRARLGIDRESRRSIA